jgi:hypothetical protein
MVSLSSSAEYKPKGSSAPDLMVVQRFAFEVQAASEPLLHNHGFEKLLLDAVDEGLAWLGGARAKQMIYYHLENDFNIKRQDIPRKIEEFDDAIGKIFGDAGALLEIQIMKKLHKKVGNSFKYPPELENLEFTEYIRTIRLSYFNKLV